MQRSTRWLLWPVGLLLIVAAGVVLFLATLDADVYRRALERQLSAAMGRTVSVGSLSISLSVPPTLSARDLRVANPTWASRPDFVTAASGVARVDLLALWQGQVELHALHLHGVDLLLERNAEGAGNWAFGAPDRADSPAALLDFGAVSLAEARIAWRQGDGSTAQLQVDSAEATIRAGAPFALHGQLTYGETPMRLAVQADASLQAALDGKPWHLSMALEAKDASLALDARLPSLDSLEGAELGFEVKGERLDAWSGVVGRTLPRWGPYRLSGQARYAQTSLQVEDLRLSLDGLPMQPSHLEIGTGTALLGANIDTRLTAEGEIGDAAFSLDARSAPLPSLQNTGGTLPLTLRATLAQFALSAEGSIALAAGVPHFDLALTAQGDAMEPARLFAGVLSRPPLPVDLSARLTHAQEGYSARNIRGRVLGATVAGDLARANGPRALLTGTLSVDRLNLGPPDGKGRKKAGAPDARSSTDAGAPAWLDRVDTDLSLRVATIAGLPLRVTKVSARVRLREGVVGLQDLAATLADTDVKADGALRWIDGRPQIDGTVRVALLDLAKLGASGAHAGSDSAFDAMLPLAPLRALDANLRIEIARIAGAPVPIDKVAARARLQGGKLAVDGASATAAKVPLQGHATLDVSGKAWRIDANAKAERIDLAALLRALKQPATAKGVIQDLQLEFGAQGTSARALLAQARLAVRSAPFSLAVGRDRAPVTVQRASIEVEPGGPVRASAAGSALGAPMELTVVGGSLAELLDFASAWPKMEANLRTTAGKESLHVTLTSGPLQRLLALRDLPLKLQATLPGAQASLQGTVNKTAASTATPLTGRVEIANLAQTAALFTTATLPAIPLTAAGRITLGDGEVVIDHLSAQAGQSDATGRLRLRWRGRPALSADLSARLIDTTQWEAGTTHAVSVLDRPIPVQALLAQDAQLRLRAERFILPGYDLAKWQFDGTLANGLIEFSTAAAEGDLRGDLRFDVRGDLPGVALRLFLKEVEAQTLYTAAAGPTGATAPRLSIRAQLAGSGVTLRDLLATGQGELLLTAGAGALPIGSAHGLERLAGNLLLVLLPGRRGGDDAQLECAAARFSIAKGIATSSDGIALRLKHMDILGSGAANLKTSEILFGYRAVRREWFSLNLLSLTSGFAKVTGTIDNPTVTLDPSGLLIEGGAAWATAGLSLLAGDLWRKFESSTDPCARIAAGAQSMGDPLAALIRALPPVKLRLPAPVKP
jgi:uncharacterized protein involved in outer membrane biogenesis